MSISWNWCLQVREQGQQQKEKSDASPFLAELLHLEDQAKQQGIGRWSKVSLKYFCCYSLLAQMSHVYVIDQSWYLLIKTYLIVIEESLN